MRASPTIRSAAVMLSLFAAPALAQEPDHSDQGQHGAMSPASERMMQAMDTMSAAMKASPMTGKPGVDFAEMMIPHHQSAIDMAEAYLASDESDPTLTRISRDVISSQEKEIAELRDWLKAHRGQ
ncbi:DUF305 domain-containing protein [Aureimonas sp. ME7]|uniref:DUF305 domain-containing protein n=1 Tax=Aureimonas sp. ME7 TaxID=2744252 RepID=UPI0015F5F856|nr:DUF305 domain-containing protein [Aureimonas sp. ME7]